MSQFESVRNYKSFEFHAGEYALSANVEVVEHYEEGYFTDAELEVSDKWFTDDDGEETRDVPELYKMVLDYQLELALSQLRNRA